MKNKKGYTLLELIFSILIFFLVIMFSSHITVKFIKYHASVRKIQKDLENAQYSLSFLSKTLRTSSIDADQYSNEIAGRLLAFDHSQGKCLKYRFNSSLHTLQLAEYSDVLVTDIDDCPLQDGPYGTFRDLTTGYVEGGFRFKKTDYSSDQMGKITISINIYPPGETPDNYSDVAKIQTSVSLRDY